MRPRKERLTRRGLGTAEVAPSSAPEEDMRSTAVSCPPASVASRQPPSTSSAPTRRRATLEGPLAEPNIAGAEKAPVRRRGTTKLPTCIDEIGPATAAATAGRLRDVIPRRVALNAAVAQAPLEPRD